jgi:beta-lactamase superfamily II metal-dependent hydrolase
MRLVGLVLFVILLASSGRAGTMTVDILDVGQGDAILIRTPADVPRRWNVSCSDGHARGSGRRTQELNSVTSGARDDLHEVPI